MDLVYGRATAGSTTHAASSDDVLPDGAALSLCGLVVIRRPMRLAWSRPVDLCKGCQRTHTFRAHSLTTK